MCGIAGVFDLKNSIEINDRVLREMASFLNYRGPDQEGYFIKNEGGSCIALAHKRLSIIDLSENGKQPMLSHDGKFIIVFNGEIYNYVELRRKLQQEGMTFKSNSDTEVILAGHEIWGIDKCLENMEGMFAFALYDCRQKQLTLARDRFGEKPLYFHHSNDFIAFSSDIRSFNPLGIRKTVNEYALGCYLAEMCTPNEQSIWNEIKKLPPAHYLKFDNSGLEIVEYWTLSYKNKIQINLNDAINETERLLNESVKLRLVSDVPVGCFLSGGIDSSLVSLLAAENYHSQIKTFSVGFEYDSFNELPYAKQVAEKIGADHHEIMINPKDLNTIDALLAEYGEPFADSSQIPTYYISKFASESVKVVLGGDGGDELFGGYKTYNQALRMDMWYKLRGLSPFVNAASRLSKMNKFQYLSGIMNKDASIIGSALFRSMGFSNLEVKNLTDNQKITTAAAQENARLIEQAQNHSDNIFDTVLHSSIKSRLVNDYLVKTDRASMFNSLELRTPFLDTNTQEFLSSLPSSYIMHNNTNKYITKKIAEKHFDNSFIYRKKQGFGIPIGEWMKKEWKNEVKNVINCENQFINFNRDYINALFEEHLSGKRDHTHKIWIIYVFNKWSASNA